VSLDLIIIKSSTSSRRSALAAILAIATLAWTGCAIEAPAVAADRRRATRTALKGLGFEESPQGWGLNLSGRVLFGSDEATLAADGAETVAQISRTLLGVGIDHVTVEGHTDNVGSEEHNLQLSQRRAEAVAAALVSRGFASVNIARRGYGSQRPIGDNTSEIGRAKNRRATLIVASI
jgi:outer membrane protein OmpA-like peptidoglycan-associated protein